MAKTRIQRHQRPMAKGKHQRTGQRAQVRENPPSGLGWGQKNWPGTGGGVAVPYGLTLFETQIVAPPTVGSVRFNNATWVNVTHIFLSETYQPGSTSDPIATLIVNDPIRFYEANNTSHWIEYKITAVSDAGAYRDYTVTYTVTAGGGWLPSAGMLLGVMERTGSPGTQQPADYDPGEHTIDEVKAHVEGLADDDQRDDITQAILDRERGGKNRPTLITWLDQQLGVV
jgi:hypothetical protein